MVLSVASAAPARRSLENGISVARRHSRQIRWLRRGMVVALGLQAALGLAFISSAARRSSSSASRPSFQATGVAALARAARVSGRFSDGGRFDASARSAVVWAASNSLIALANVDFDFQQADRARLRIRAKTGTVDQVAETLTLDNGVEVVGPNNRRATLQSLVIDLRDGTLRDAAPASTQSADGPAAMILALVLAQRQMLASAK